MKTSYYIEVLKEKVKQEIQSEVISVRTTNDLSEKIFERTQKKISSSTLQRLYELVAIKTFPSKNTLNVLSEFVGFNNWEHFCKNEDEPHLSLKENIVPDAMALKLFEISLKNHNFKTVLEYLKLLPINISLGDTQKKISEIFGEVFRKDREARNILLPKLAKMPEGRLYFYETFVDIDFLSVYYADSLSEYEKYINPKEKIKSKRDFIFVNTIKFLNYLKTNQKKKTLQKGYLLTKHFDQREVCFENIADAYPIARYHSSYLVYLFLSNNLSNKKLEETILLLENQMLKFNNNLYKTAILSELFQALYFCGRYRELLFLYEKYEKQNLLSYEIASSYLPLMNYVKLSYLNLGLLDKANSLIIKSPQKISKDYTDYNFFK